MRQFNFEYDSIEAAVSGLADVKKALEEERTAGRCSEALLLIFLSDSNKVRTESIVDKLTADRCYFETAGGVFTPVNE